MGPAEQEELQQLRLRAYGPRADIDRDADAVQRLRELEERMRSVAVDESPVASALPDASDAETGVTDDDDEDDDGGDGAPALGDTPEVAPRDGRVVIGEAVRRMRARVRTREGRRVALWAATLATALVVALVAVIVVQRVSTAPLTPAAAQVARLDPDTAFETPQFFQAWSRAGAVRAFDAYGGLRAVLVRADEQTATPEGAQECLYLAEQEQLSRSSDNGYGGAMWGGCAAGAFPATAQFVVTADNADEVRTRFPIGTALQFAYDRAADQVIVFEIPPVTVEARGA